MIEIHGNMSFKYNRSVFNGVTYGISGTFLTFQEVLAKLVNINLNATLFHPSLSINANPSHTENQLKQVPLITF